jgi:signal transduction histidine kinase
VREAAPESHDELVEQARIQVHRTIEEARRAVWNLRHSATPQDALGAKLADVARQFGKEHDIPLYCDIQPAATQVDEGLEEQLLLVAREALTNVVQHAQAHHIHVRLWFSAKRVHLLIADDGCGFDTAAVSEDPMHYGLVGMRERMEHVGGRFLVESRPGQGTRIEVEAAPQARRETAGKMVRG